MKKLITVIFTTLLIVGCAKQNIKNDTLVPISETKLTEKSSISEQPLKSPYRKVNKDIYTSDYEEQPEVIRYNRYTLVSTAPQSGQKYLLEQIVNVKIPVKRNNYYYTVENGIQTTLKNTGFSLCALPSDPDVKTLFKRQLPKVHYQFGSMKLRDALQMLVGEAFELVVDDVKREICFEKRYNIPQRIQPKEQIEAQKPNIKE